MVTGGKYHGELIKYRRQNDEMELGAYSETVTITPLKPPAKLEKTEITVVVGLMNAIEENLTLRNSYQHLLSAWELQKTSGSKPLERSILQHYVLSLEAIVNGTMKEVRKEKRDQIRLKERSFAAEFAKEIRNRADKPEAIRNASTRLREISLVNMMPSLDEVAPILDISDDLTDLAKNLYRFRSRGLSHPGEVKVNEIKKWLGTGGRVEEVCLADRIVQKYFKGYCEKMVKAVK